MITETYHTRFYHSEGRDTGGEAALSVFLSSKSFQFAIFDKARQKVTELCHIGFPPGNEAEGINSEHLEFLLNNYSLSKATFSNVQISLLHNDFALMPHAFAETTDVRTVLGFTGTLPGNANTGKHELKDLDFCFSHNSGIIQALERNFSNGVVRHAGAVAVQLFMSHHALRGCNVFLQIHEGMIELALRHNNELLMYNVFAVSGKEDILYYLLFAAEQFGLAPQEMVLGLAGALPADDELVRNLRKYTGQVQLLVNDPGIQPAGKISSVPAHFYFSLLNQHLCEL